jgi:hypothetical protein
VLLTTVVQTEAAEKRTLADACSVICSDGCGVNELTKGFGISDLRELIKNPPGDKACVTSNIFLFAGKLGGKEELAWLVSQFQLQADKDSKMDIIEAFGIMAGRGITEARIELDKLAGRPGPFQGYARIVIGRITKGATGRAPFFLFHNTCVKRLVSNVNNRTHVEFSQK